jgi:hypothetical protein
MLISPITPDLGWADGSAAHAQQAEGRHANDENYDAQVLRGGGCVWLVEQCRRIGYGTAQIFLGAILKVHPVVKYVPCYPIYHLA